MKNDGFKVVLSGLQSGRLKPEFGNLTHILAIREAEKAQELKEKQCEDCEGAGSGECSECDGSGEISCVSCEGSGLKANGNC